MYDADIYLDDVPGPGPGLAALTDTSREEERARWFEEGQRQYREKQRREGRGREQQSWRGYYIRLRVDTEQYLAGIFDLLGFGRVVPPSDQGLALAAQRVANYCMTTQPTPMGFSGPWTPEGLSETGSDWEATAEHYRQWALRYVSGLFSILGLGAIAPIMSEGLPLVARRLAEIQRACATGAPASQPSSSYRLPPGMQPVVAGPSGGTPATTPYRPLPRSGGGQQPALGPPDFSFFQRQQAAQAPYGTAQAPPAAGPGQAPAPASAPASGSAVLPILAGLAGLFFLTR